MCAPCVDDPTLKEFIKAGAVETTYITLMFEAGASVPYVVNQVGHSDSATTLGVYSQALERRSVGEAFDRLMGMPCRREQTGESARESRPPATKEVRVRRRSTRF